MISPPKLLLVAVFCGGALLGWLLPRGAQPNPPAWEKTQVSQLPASTSPAGSGGIAESAPEETPLLSPSSRVELSKEGQTSTAQALLSAAREPDFFRRRNKTFEIAAQLDAQGIASAMAEAESFSALERDWMQPTLISRWADLDPQAAYQWTCSLPGGEHREFLLSELFSSLGSKNPATALELLKSFQQAGIGRAGRYQHELYRGWAQQEPARATQHALSIANKRERDSALSSSMGTWAKKDPKGALAWAEQVPDPEMRKRARSAVLEPWARSDPKGAASYALALSPGKERNGVISSIVTACAEQDRELTHRLLAELPAGSQRENTLSSLVSNLAYRDPKAASEYVLLLPPNRQHQASSVATYFAQQDIAGALQWASQITSAQTRENVLSQMLQRWAEDDPQAAVAYCAQNLPEDPRALPAALGSWAETDPQGALSRAEALGAGKVRDAALSRCLGVIARTDPAQALQRAAALQGNARESALNSVVMSWAQEDVAAAAEWCLQPGNERGQSLHMVMNTWAREAPVQAATWLQQLPTGPAKDNAVHAFATQVADSDPEGAAAWAASLTDQQRRDNAVSSVVDNWLRHDKAAATNWLQQAAGVSEQTRQRLLNSAANQ